MAPTKKTKSTPNRTTSILMKALKKNKSVGSEPVNEKVVQPSQSNSSPKSVKQKAISTNLQTKISKKRKRGNQAVPEKKGLKLLKRGPVTMHRIVRRKILGIKHQVTFNAKGEPYGEVASEMQSYIGVLARTKAPIWYDSWKAVPKERKNKIWDCVQMAYDVPSTARNMVLKSAAQKWREFKSRLTTDYVLPHSHQRELLELPPADYTFIEKAHWDIFVADRLSPEFKEIHEKLQKRRKLNKYPHCISRKGYANLEQEMSQDDPEAEIDRSSTWLEARKGKDGNYKSDKITEIAEEIVKMKKKVSDGEVTEEGTEDVLTKVLGKPEHRGRVRGQGSHVKQSVYFNLPRQRKKRSIDERIQDGIQRFMKEETERIVRERDEFWATELAKMKAAFCGKNLQSDNSPNVGSQQGSCSKGANGIMKELELQGVKKKLDLINDGVADEGKYVENKDPEVANPEVAKEIEEKDVEIEEKNVEVEEVVEVKDDQVVIGNRSMDDQSSEWGLAIGSPSNVVAHATVDTLCKFLHGVPLSEENARVSITRAIQGSVKIPFPIQDEITTVEQAVGTFIAWPRHLIREVKTSTAAIKGITIKGITKVAKKMVPKKYKNVRQLGEEQEYVLHMGDDYPVHLKRLWLWAKDALKDGQPTNFQLCEEAFGATRKQLIFLSDVYALCSGGEISASVICMFINLLQLHLRRHKMSDLVAFVDPVMIGAIGCGTALERSRALSLRFKNAKPGQIFLLPYNAVNHWALTAVNPDSQTVYHMDPLKRRIASEEWIEVVDNAIKLHKESANKIPKKKIVWENLAGVPLQSGTKDCGLFLMRYLKEICLDKELKFNVKWLRRSNLAYGIDELNEIRTEWARHFLKNHAR